MLLGGKPHSINEINQAENQKNYVTLWAIIISKSTKLKNAKSWITCK